MEMVVVAVDRWSSHEGMYISIIEMVHVSHSVDRWSLYTGTYIRMLASLRRSMGYPKVVTMDTCPLCTYVRTVVKWSLWTGVPYVLYSENSLQEIHYNHFHSHSRTYTGSHEFLFTVDRIITVRDFFTTSFTVCVCTRVPHLCIRSLKSSMVRYLDMYSTVHVCTCVPHLCIRHSTVSGTQLLFVFILFVHVLTVRTVYGKI